MRAEREKRRRIKNSKQIILICMVFLFLLSGCGKKEEDVIVLRVNNWEEYIDEGGWDLEDAVVLSEDTVILPENGMIEDFQDWFYQTYGKKVKVEYSTFGTNEELYNQITLGDAYDLVCPSEYMIMKLIAEDLVLPFSEDFYSNTEYHYYANGVSPYIKQVYDELEINGEPLSKYAAGYMWGTLGIVYNPEEVTEEEAAHWNLLLMDPFYKRITIKDSIRDAFFAGVSIYQEQQILDPAFLNQADYKEQLGELLNRTDPKTVDAVEEILSRIKDRVYSFETDSGKADMVTGKVVANQQWSGDAVYTLDQAEEDGVFLCYSAPEEATNLWFDGWCMLKDAIAGDQEKQMAAEAFIHFVSRPDNAIRNMEYIGYTSVISGGESDQISQYIEWTYGAEEEETETVDYEISYFFGREYFVTTPEDQTRRQLYAQYPPISVMDRCVVMEYFNPEENRRINRMWTNIRCFDLVEWWKRQKK
ncbi:MAG: ABC transporter substrate-binding protein [Lachnospiraceae bacterium]|nr:ABC transporter substrate-binding protein [Lachnospiraceae bacterium]